MLASLLLRIGALVPLVYYGVLIAASLAWPGLNHMTSPISDLDQWHLRQRSAGEDRQQRQHEADQPGRAVLAKPGPDQS